MASTVATLQAAPLPTNVASMKSMVADRSIQARFGGRHGGGWGHRGFGSWGYRGRGWGGSAFAGALIGGAIASSAYGYYGSGPYYGGMTPATATIRPTAVIIGARWLLPTLRIRPAALGLLISGNSDGVPVAFRFLTQ
jgi:hypothetical protein